MRLAAKRAASTLAIALPIVVALVGGVWLAGNTDAGRGLIERSTYRLTGGYVKLSGLGGTFPHRLTLDHLALDDGHGVWLSADHVSLRWSPLALLLDRISVDLLEAARVHVERAPRAGGKSGGRPWIPHIDIARFRVGAVELAAPLVGTPATLTADGMLDMRSLDAATAAVNARRMDGDGDYALKVHIDPKRVDATLAAHEPAGGPLENLLSVPGLGVLVATLKMSGPRDAERLDAVVDAGRLHGKLAGRLDLIHDAADLDYSVDSPALAPRADVAWSRLVLQGDWHGPISSPTAHGHFEVDELRVGSEMRLRDLHAELSASAGKLELRSRIAGLELPGPIAALLAADPLELDATLGLDQPLRPLAVTVAHPLFSLAGRTDVKSAAAGRRGHLVLKVPDVAPAAALLNEDVRGSATVTADLGYQSGTSTVTLQADAAVSGGASEWARLLGTHPALELSASLMPASLGIQSLHLAAGAGSVTLSGTAARSPNTRSFAASLGDIRVKWQMEAADLQQLSPDLAGDVRASGQLSGSLASLGIDAAATSKLSVRGSPTGTVEATLHARGLPKAPSGSLQARGMLDGAPLDLDAQLDRIEARELRVRVRRANWKSAQLDGDLTTDAGFTQSHGALHLRIADLNDFTRLAGTTLAGAVEVSLGFKPVQGSTDVLLDVDGAHLAAGPLAGNVRVHAAGPANAVETELTARIPSFRGSAATLATSATVDLNSRVAHLTNLSVGYRDAAVRLLAPSTWTLTAGVSVDDFKLGLGAAVFDLSGQLAPTLDVRASLDHVDPDAINRLEPQLLAAGSLTARARLQGELASPSGTIRVDAVGLQFADDAAAGLPPASIRANARLADGMATLRATLEAGSGSRLAAAGTAPLRDNGALDLKLVGKLDVGLANPLLEARGLHASGGLSVDATVTGSPGEPEVEGGITLADGSLRDYVHGVNLTAIDAQVTGNQSGLKIKSFRAHAAPGNLAMTGTIGVLQRGIPLDLKITAKNAQPITTGIISANLDAEITVRGTALDHLDFAGSIEVNRATIGIPDSLPPEIAVLDVRRRGQAPPAPSTNPLVINLDLAIHARNEILVEGRGLNAELGGDIEITGTADAPKVNGGFSLQRGSFTLAGNRLSLVPPGGVGFDGAGLRKTIDPSLDFTAQTTVSDYQIKLVIAGLADTPRFALTSVPDLPQDQIMSLLLFSEPAAQLSALQVAEVAAALVTLTGVGGGSSNPLTKLQKTLGLDRLTVGTNTTTTATGATENSGAAIAAGRYITKRVYVEAKQSTTGTSQVQVDVDLTKHLRLQTQLGNGTATTQGTTPDNDPGSVVGLSYHFEY